MLTIPFFTALLSALAVENVVLTRALGMDRSVLYLKSAKQGILYGGLLTAIMTLSAFPVSLANYLLRDNPYIAIVRAPAYLLGICLVFLSVYGAMYRFLPQAFEAVRRMLPFATFNTVLFGAFYVSAMEAYSFSKTVGYALGAGIGYTAAILVIYYARKRLALSSVPRAFRGLPILLVYIGLLSLALFGLLGHGLPS